MTAPKGPAPVFSMAHDMLRCLNFSRIFQLIMETLTDFKYGVCTFGHNQIKNYCYVSQMGKKTFLDDQKSWYI